MMAAKKPNIARRFVQKTKKLFGRKQSLVPTSTTLDQLDQLRSQSSYSTNPPVTPLEYVERLNGQLEAAMQIFAARGVSEILQNEDGVLYSPTGSDHASSISSELSSEELDLELPPPALDLDRREDSDMERTQMSIQALPEFVQVDDDLQGLSILVSHKGDCPIRVTD